LKKISTRSGLAYGQSKVFIKLNKYGFPVELEEIIKLKEILKKWIEDGEYKKVK